MEGESEGGGEGEVVRVFWGARLKSGAREWEGGGDGEVVGGFGEVGMKGGGGCGYPFWEKGVAVLARDSV